MRRLLVLRGGALGDLIVTLPAIARLRNRWPEAEIVLVGNAKNDIMRRLTSATILAGIATAITAWFGNNFPAPEFELTFGYPLAMALTVGALGLGHAYLRRRGFI